MHCFSLIDWTHHFSLFCHFFSFTYCSPLYILSVYYYVLVCNLLLQYQSRNSFFYRTVRSFKLEQWLSVMFILLFFEVGSFNVLFVFLNCLANPFIFVVDYIALFCIVLLFVCFSYHSHGLFNSTFKYKTCLQGL